MGDASQVVDDVYPPQPMGTRLPGEGQALAIWVAVGANRHAVGGKRRDQGGADEAGRATDGGERHKWADGGFIRL